MKWLAKVAAFKLLSNVPGGAAIYRNLQRNITHSLVPTLPRVEQKINVGLQYWDWLKSRKCSLNGPHLDFGSGWHPTIPLLYYCLGIERQYLFDAAPLLNRETVDETVKAFRRIVMDPGWPRQACLCRLPEINPRSADVNAEYAKQIYENESIMPCFNEPSWAEYLRKMGISYHAPCDTTFQEIAGMIEIITCTQVLYYIGRAGLRRCFHQLRQSLKSGGKFLASIHLNDTHAAPGNGISQYNHLRYSPTVWEKWINSSLMSSNRLKAIDYRELLEECGFEVTHFEVAWPTASDIRELDQIQVHSCFNHYSKKELGAKHLFFVAQRA